jgi:hypothetical protein
MYEGGAKDIRVQMSDIRLFLRLHVFMLLNHFFVEGMPKYEWTDIDLPSGYNDDEESYAPIKFSLLVHESLLCIDDENDAIGCKANISIAFERLNLREVKEGYIYKTGIEAE